MNKFTKLKVNIKPSKRLSKVQRAVLQEVFADASLTADFLVKACGYIKLTTNADELKLSFEGGSGLFKLKGKLTYEIISQSKEVKQ